MDVSTLCTYSCPTAPTSGACAWQDPYEFRAQLRICLLSACKSSSSWVHSPQLHGGLAPQRQLGNGPEANSQSAMGMLRGAGAWWASHAQAHSGVTCGTAGALAGGASEGAAWDGDMVFVADIFDTVSNAFAASGGRCLLLCGLMLRSKSCCLPLELLDDLSQRLYDGPAATQHQCPCILTLVMVSYMEVLLKRLPLCPVSAAGSPHNVHGPILKQYTCAINGAS